MNKELRVGNKVLGHYFVVALQQLPGFDRRVPDSNVRVFFT